MASVASAITIRFALPAAFIDRVLSESPSTMMERDEYIAPSNGINPEIDFPRHERFSPRIASFRKDDPADAYIDYLDLADPREVIPSEPENGIRMHETFTRYVEWYRQGLRPPYPSVFEQIYDGQRKLIGANRRRILAAQTAGIELLEAWLGRWNRETGLPLKYGDILSAAGKTI